MGYIFHFTIWYQSVCAGLCSSLYSHQQVFQWLHILANTWYCQTLNIFPVWHVWSCILVVFKICFFLHFLESWQSCTVFCRFTGHSAFLFCEVPVPVFCPFFFWLHQWACVPDGNALSIMCCKYLSQFDLPFYTLSYLYSSHLDRTGLYFLSY